jgi:ketosteroid isomerase-like protein
MSKMLALVCAAGLAAAPGRAGTLAEAQEAVRRTEIAFARTMADRDHAGFVSFLAEDTIFMGPTKTSRGRQQVADEWKPFYQGAQAPFSWEPEQVEVIDSGTLAFSAGPVKDPQGRRVGTFNSVWRLEPDGRWRIVLDRGCPRCECPKAVSSD